MGVIRHTERLYIQYTLYLKIYTFFQIITSSFFQKRCCPTSARKSMIALATRVTTACKPITLATRMWIIMLCLNAAVENCKRYDRKEKSVFAPRRRCNLLGARAQVDAKTPICCWRIEYELFHPYDVPRDGSLLSMCQERLLRSPQSQLFVPPEEVNPWPYSQYKWLPLHAGFCPATERPSRTSCSARGLRWWRAR